MAQQSGSSSGGAGDKEPGAGIRGTRTTGVFRVVNFELFARPVSIGRQDDVALHAGYNNYHEFEHSPPVQRKGMMVFGAVCMAGCLGYLFLLNMSAEGGRAQTRHSTNSGRTRWDG